MVSIREVARRAGVSVGTVSRVMNRNPTVQPATRERVEAAIQELDYVPNAIAASLRSRRTHTLGLIVPDVTNPYFAELVRHIERAAAAAGNSLLLGNSDNDPLQERLYIRTLSTRRVDGLIIAPTDASALHAETTRVPIVLIDRPVAGHAVVASNHREGAREAAEYLAQLGHRLIACIAGPADIAVARDRHAGWLDVAADLLASAGIDPVSYARFGAFDFLSGEEMARSLLALDPRPTAIVTGSDQQAVGAMRVAADMKIPVPQALSIVGFDDIPLAAVVSPRLTTVAQPIRAISEEAVSALLRLRDGIALSEHRPLRTRLEIRESCAPPANGSR